MAVVVRMDIGTLTRVNAARETFRDGDVECVVGGCRAPERRSLDLYACAWHGSLTIDGLTLGDLTDLTSLTDH